MTAEADIGPLLREAVARYNAMSPVDKALLHSDQRRSFVRGQIGRDPGPDVLAEEVRRLRAENTALRQECAAVLEPFAEAGWHFDHYGHNEVTGGQPSDTVYFGWPEHKVTIGDFRTASALRAHLLKERDDG